MHEQPSVNSSLFVTLNEVFLMFVRANELRKRRALGSHEENRLLGEKNKVNCKQRQSNSDSVTVGVTTVYKKSD